MAAKSVASGRALFNQTRGREKSNTELHPKGGVDRGRLAYVAKHSHDAAERADARNRLAEAAEEAPSYDL